MNIYVGNLPHSVTDDELRQAFENFGTVESASIIKDKVSGDSKGFGFVLMPSQDEAQAAIDALNEQDFKGRTISVAEAKPRTESRNRGGFGRRGGYGGGRSGDGRPGGGGGGGGRPGGGGGGRPGGRGRY